MRSYASYTFSSLLGLAALVLAQNQRVNFNQVANINGDMTLNALDFPDGTKIETFSQTQQQVLVNQNPNPLPPNNVVGSTGQPFVALQKQSIIIQTNQAVDLVGGQIELPIDQAQLDQQQVLADNAFVAMLSQDRQAWIIQEAVKSINGTDKTARMVKLNRIDGEYMLLGRKTAETGQSLTTFGNQAANQVKIDGSGIQEVEFTDGFRMSIRSSQPLTLQTEVINGVNAGQLTSGAQAVNNFRYLVTTSLGGLQPGFDNMVAVVQLPINPARLMATAQAMGLSNAASIQLNVAQRGVLQNPGGAQQNLIGRSSRIKRQDNQGKNNRAGKNNNNQNNNNNNNQNNNNNNQNNNNLAIGNQPLLLNNQFQNINSQPVLDMVNMRVAVPVTSLDGEFILTVGGNGAAAAPAVAAPAVAAPAVAAPAVAAPVAAAPAVAAPAAPAPAGIQQMGKSPTRKTRRQAPAAAGGITIQMTDLKAMVDRMTTGAVDTAPVWSMMTNYARANGAKNPEGFPAPAPPTQAAPAPAAAAPAPPAPAPSADPAPAADAQPAPAPDAQPAPAPEAQPSPAPQRRSRVFRSLE